MSCDQLSGAVAYTKISQRIGASPEGAAIDRRSHTSDREGKVRCRWNNRIKVPPIADGRHLSSSVRHISATQRFGVVSLHPVSAISLIPLVYPREQQFVHLAEKGAMAPIPPPWIRHLPGGRRAADAELSLIDREGAEFPTGHREIRMSPNTNGTGQR